jgi:hypothetical protein
MSNNFDKPCYTSIIVKYLGATNTRGSRLSVCYGNVKKVYSFHKSSFDINSKEYGSKDQYYPHYAEACKQYMIDNKLVWELQCYTVDHSGDIYTFLFSSF